MWRARGSPAPPPTMDERTPERPRFVAVVGPLNVPSQPVAAGRRPGVPHAHVRPGPRRVRRTDRRAGGRRRRSAADRDRVRHAERQGGDRCGAGAGPGAAALAVLHGHRPQRPQPLGPDGRGLLGLGRACCAARRRRQLLAGRGPDAALLEDLAASPRPTRRATRTRGSRTRSAPMTSCPADTSRYLGEFARAVSSTSSAAAAGPRRSTCARSRRRSSPGAASASVRPAPPPLRRPRAVRDRP